jgi:type III pantothenate kinase
MNLVVDIGNTRLKIAIFDKETLLAWDSEETISIGVIEKYISAYSAERLIVSSVRGKIPTNFEEAIRNLSVKKLWFSHKTPIPIRNEYETPETLGLDRLAGVIGAAAIFPKQHCLVIDAGTCITYDFVTAQGTYIGGSISLGLMMRYRALHEFTAALPLLNKQRLNTFVGYNTTTAIQTGVELGLYAEIQGFIKQYFDNFGQIKVIMTGGDAAYLATSLKNEVFLNPHLVLIGLNKILNNNAKFLE